MEEILFINKSGFNGQEKWGRDDLKTLIFRFFTRPDSTFVAEEASSAQFRLVSPHMPRATENISTSLEFEKFMQLKRVYKARKVGSSGNIHKTWGGK